MQEKIETISRKVFICDTCGMSYPEDDFGKWAIFHCPEHGEFCNDGCYRCGIYREVEGKVGMYACCPICGWCSLEDDGDVYDDRKGSIPKTEKEIKSFQHSQDYVLQHIKDGISYKRIRERVLKED